MMWVGFAVWCLFGLIMIAGGVATIQYGPEGLVMIVSGLIMIGIGFLVSWIGSFLTYGFGQIVDNTDKMVALLEKQTGVTADSLLRPQYTVQPDYAQPQYTPYVPTENYQNQSEQ